MTSFKDSHGNEYTIRITLDGVERVRDKVESEDGSEVDIFEAVEKGDFSAFRSMETVSETVFYLILPEFISNFDVEAYDKKNADIFEIFPERKTEPKRKKAFRAFTESITGLVMEEMTEALMQAITNFTTNPERREAIRELLQKEKEMETLTVKQLKEKQLARMDEMQPVILEKLVSKLNENEVTLEI